MVTEPGLRESIVVNAYTGRAERRIPSERLHEAAYDTAARRYTKSGYLRLGSPADHLLTVVRTALAARRLTADVLSGGSVGRDPARGGTITLSCPETHPATRVCTKTLAVLGWSAVLIPASDPRTVLRVRYGPGGLYCPVRWLTRDDWTMHYCGEHIGHDGPEHFDRHTGGMWWDGDDDGLEWKAAVPALATRRRRPGGHPNADLPVLDDRITTASDTSIALPEHRVDFAAQLHTTGLRRSTRPGLQTFGPLDQDQPRSVKPGAIVIVGDGTPWQLGTDGLWTPVLAEPTTITPERTGRTWQALAFRYAPVTVQRHSDEAARETT
ncbi:hypothetical protein [Streptomyces sp. NPDC056672]|uniref:hypothetical protein n=1 Tax=Streptomyces sp. NPDC056672 TaxID=3345906 RepID=UPI0036A39897